MPQVTYPNQRMIKVHRERATTDFLGIKNENWQAASRDLGAHALRLYLYIAANANNFTLALSPAALQQDLGMARSTYHDQFYKLVDRGYLVQSGGNTYEFFEVPQAGAGRQRRSQELSAGYNFENNTTDGATLPQFGDIVLQEDIEINNTDNSIDSSINSNERTIVKQGEYTF